MRVVLDTNVLVSALLFRSGSLAWIRHGWQSSRLQPLVSRDTVSELLRVLAYPKFALSAADRDHLLADYLPWCETIGISAAMPDATMIPACRDHHDQPFLDLAIAGGADALVTGDRDLLVLAGTVAVPVITPADLKTRLP